MCLWIAAITVAISLGGNVFQRAVVDPVWSGSPPDSVRAFAAGPLPSAVGRFHLNPLYGVGLLCLLACPVLAWSHPALRTWLLVAIISQIVIVVATVLYFYPINDKLLNHASGLDAATITTLTHRWLLADRFRLALRFITFLSLMRAMMLAGAMQP